MRPQKGTLDLSSFPPVMSTPDVQIFPTATGNAVKTVEEHQDPQELIFYSGWV